MELKEKRQEKKKTRVGLTVLPVQMMTFSLSLRAPEAPAGRFSPLGEAAGSSGRRADGGSTPRTETAGAKADSTAEEILVQQLHSLFPAWPVSSRS